MIIFKRKQISIDAFTHHSGVYNHFPIQSSEKFLPEWWKSIKNNYTINQNGIDVPHSTIKRCTGIIENYKNSFMIPMWSDLIINTKENGDWVWAGSAQNCDELLYLNSHDRMQYGETFNDLIHVKITSPWVIEEKTGIKFHLTSPFWNNIENLQNYFIAPGIIDFKYQNDTNVNLFLPKKNNTVQLNCGSPLCQIIPLTEYDVKIKCHQLTKEEYNNRKLKNTTHWFTGNYSKRKKVIDKISKCPFK